METLESLVVKLPQELHREARTYIEFLLEKHRKRTKRRPRLDWASALRDLREQYTSVELQHRIVDWRHEGP